MPVHQDILQIVPTPCSLSLSKSPPVLSTEGEHVNACVAHVMHEYSVTSVSSDPRGLHLPSLLRVISQFVSNPEHLMRLHMQQHHL